MVIIPPTDECILANGSELERWDFFNKQLYSVLFLFTKGTAKSFIVRFAGRPALRQLSDGQAVWNATTEKYLHSSIQRRCILMPKLNSMVMMPNQDADG